MPLRSRRSSLVLAVLTLGACADAAPPHAMGTPESLTWSPLSWDDADTGWRELVLRHDSDETAVLSGFELVGLDAVAWEVEAPGEATALNPGERLRVRVRLLGTPGPEPSQETELSAALVVRAASVGHLEGSGCGGGNAGEPSSLSVPLAATLSCDFDGDGSSALACGGEDCADADPRRFPGNPELCDGLDQDCDGYADPPIDQDGDGSALCGDCDDGDSDRRPGAPELCDGKDNDCDGQMPNEQDGDGDGHWFCRDCDDGRPEVRPGAEELCDGLDDDCDGLADADPLGELDSDGDGALSCADCDDMEPARAPDLPEVCDRLDNDCDGSAAGEGDSDGDGVLACQDCDDGDGTAWPLAPELCDGIDNNCDGLVAGEGDADGDASLACADCDDSNAARFPGALESCDGLDNDCDGSAAGEADGDGDGSLACADCDDGDAARFPGAAESCDALDNDCDGQAPGEQDGDGDGSLTCADCDDADPLNTPEALETCDGQDNDCSGDAVGEEDGDGDSWLACEDCDDGDVSVHPGAPEVCDGLDDDCDGVAPGEGDGDGDGWLACAECDDDGETTWPGAPEVCDGTDNNCDLSTDEGTRRVPLDFPTVQDAVDGSLDGDTICVSPGTYYENVEIIGRALHIIGWAGAEQTILDGQGLDTVVDIEGGDPSGNLLQGFTVTAGSAEQTYGAGGVYVLNAVVALSDLVVEGNTGGWAGGVRIESSTITLSYIEIRENFTAHAFNGVGGLLVNNSTMDAHSLLISNNTAADGVGGFVFSASNPIVGVDLLVEGNQGTEAGGGSFSGSAPILLSSVVFRSNSSAEMAGGVRVSSGASVGIVNGLFSGNFAAQNGGAVYAQHAGTSLTLENCTFRGNEATGGGAGLLIAHAAVVVRSCEFSGNAVGGGASAYGVYAGGTLDVSWSNFWSNGFLAYDPMPGPVGSNGNVSLNPSYLDPLWDGLDPSSGHLLASSALIDLGDPTVLDPDGSRSDIGFLGGPGAASFDLDGDGSPMWWQPGPYDSTAYPPLNFDCDDLDSSTGPLVGCGP